MNRGSRKKYERNLAGLNEGSEGMLRGKGSSDGAPVARVLACRDYLGSDSLVPRTAVVIASRAGLHLRCWQSLRSGQLIDGV